MSAPALTILTPEEIEEEFSDLGPEHIRVCGVPYFFSYKVMEALAKETYDKLWSSTDLRAVRLAIGYTFGYAPDIQLAFWYKTGESTLSVYGKEPSLFSPSSEPCLLRALIDFQNVVLSYNEAGCSCNDCGETKLDMLCRKTQSDTFSSMPEFRNMIRDALAPETPLIDMKTSYFGEMN